MLFFSQRRVLMQRALGTQQLEADIQERDVTSTLPNWVRVRQKKNPKMSCVIRSLALMKQKTHVSLLSADDVW